MMHIFAFLANITSTHIYFFKTTSKISKTMQTCSVTNITQTFGYCIKDLRISELLLLKHSLEKLEEQNTNLQNRITNVNRIDKPQALALVDTEWSFSNSDKHPLWHLEEKPSKLQTLFQISITALSFLSFGGYLLCLIVQGIKSKGTTYLHPTVSAITAGGGFKRIKVYRRSRRSGVYKDFKTKLNNFYEYKDYLQKKKNYIKF